MTSFSRRQYSTASPVLAIQPNASHEPPLSATGLAQQHAPPTASFGARAVGAPRPAPNVSCGRKRSRDEASINLEPNTPPPLADDAHQDWAYGEGMVLIKPQEGYVADASSQSGTWLEEKKASDEEASRRQQPEQRPGLRSHKSQRMDSCIDAASPLNASNGGDMACAVPERAGAPVIDDCTLHLGIGWSRISADGHIQAAARGWARFIENHFALVNVRICLESKGLQSYLVEASDGYFLFAENLRRGQLVSRTVDGALRNLQLSPPTFEGPEMLMDAANHGPSEACADTEMKVD